MTSHFLAASPIILHHLLICSSLLLLPHPDLKLNLSGSRRTQRGQIHRGAATFETAQAQVLKTLLNLSSGRGLPPSFLKIRELEVGSLCGQMQRGLVTLRWPHFPYNSASSKQSSGGFHPPYLCFGQTLGTGGCSEIDQDKEGEGQQGVSWALDVRGSLY